ncbi:DNA cytosine methyltransferase [Euzebya pacifica]|uniref:DNA cytosine methyltransferase n=1 Tax=Euzebya pacifica TaxID=1608957 RepID=UPI000DF7F1FF|nr:DNA cytosine methyltransferase [Euzebya pacifica]
MTDLAIPPAHAPAAVRAGRPLSLGGLFSGIGGFELAWRRQGGRVAWMCEIDPDARAVLRRRFPGVPIYTDVRDVDPAAVEAVDVLTGGSPCTTFSAAGLRTGMGGESGLVMEMLRIIDGLAARGLSDVLWENVPNVFSVTNDDGSAVWPQLVAAFLHGCEVTGQQADDVDSQFPGDRTGIWFAGIATTTDRALAWRVLNSLHVGVQVPQRRRRLYAHLAIGDGAPERAVAGLLNGTAAAGTRSDDGRWVPPFGSQLDLFADQRASTVSLLGDGSADALVDVSEGRCVAGPVADGTFCPGGLAEHSHLHISDLHDRDAPARYRLSAKGRLGTLLRALRRDVPMDPLLAEALAQGIPEAIGQDLFDRYVTEARNEADPPTHSEETLAALAAVDYPEGEVTATVHFRLKEFGYYVDSPFSATLLARDYKGGTDVVVEVIGADAGPPAPLSVTLSAVEKDLPTLFGEPVRDGMSPSVPPPAPRFRCRRLTPPETAALQGFPDVVSVPTEELTTEQFIDIALWSGMVRVVTGVPWRFRDASGFPLPNAERLDGTVSFDLGGAVVKLDAAAFADPAGHDLEIDGAGLWEVVPPAWSTIPRGVPRADWNAAMTTASARFKATGNAVSANVVEWAFARILAPT